MPGIRLRRSDPPGIPNRPPTQAIQHVGLRGALPLFG
jgi:hypothetical protein